MSGLTEFFLSGGGNKVYLILILFHIVFGIITPDILLLIARRRQWARIWLIFAWKYLSWGLFLGGTGLIVLSMTAGRGNWIQVIGLFFALIFGGLAIFWLWQSILAIRRKQSL